MGANGPMLTPAKRHAVTPVISPAIRLIIRSVIRLTITLAATHAGFGFDWSGLCVAQSESGWNQRGLETWGVAEHGYLSRCGLRGEACARRLRERSVFNCGLGLREPCYIRAKNRN